MNVSAFRAAEEYLVHHQNDVDRAARTRAAELRSTARECSLKLSEKASDSAEAVLQAAKVLRELSVCLHQIREDVRDSKLKLKQLEDSCKLEDNEFNIVNEGTSKMKTVPNTIIVISENAFDFFSFQTSKLVQSVSSAASSSSDCVTCLVRASDVLYQHLCSISKESEKKGFLRKFPSWATQQVHKFIQTPFLPLVFGVSGSDVSLEGKEFNQDEWRSLANGLNIASTSLKEFKYLFKKEIQPIIQGYLVDLLIHAQSKSMTEVNDMNNIPFRLALVKILPVLDRDSCLFDFVRCLLVLRTLSYLKDVETSVGEKYATNLKLELEKVLMERQILL